MTTFAPVARRLEELLGDPYDPANQVGFAALLAADEAGQPCAAGEDLLHRWGLHAEFVPTELGGRWQDLDQLIRRVRPVFRRDPALGLGYGVTSLMAAVNVWTGGTPEQRRQVADLLLDGQRLAVGYHELAHGNDFGGNELRADLADGQLVLSGAKQVVNNAERAAAVVIFARTSPPPGPRSHSLVLVPLDVDHPGVRQLPRFRTAGLRGCLLGGFELADLPVSTTDVLGPVGGAVEIAMRSFQVTRIALPGLAIGALDTAVGAVTRFAAGRTLYRSSVVGFPHARNVLAAAFADLLVGDALSRVAARVLHLRPGRAAPVAAAVKYLVPLLVQDAVRDLSVVLGARSYLRTGEYAIVGKLLRDLPALSIGHAGGIACLLAIVGQLPGLARRGFRPEDVHPESFYLDQPLPALDFGRLAVASVRDPLAGALCAPTGAVAALERTSPDGVAAHALARFFADDLRGLAAEVGGLPPSSFGVAAATETLQLAERYCVLLAATACIGVWHHHHEHGPGTFLASPLWLQAALTRLVDRVRATPLSLPPTLVEHLVGEVTNRIRDGRSLCLDVETMYR